MKHVQPRTRMPRLAQRDFLPWEQFILFLTKGKAGPVL